MYQYCRCDLDIFCHLRKGKLHMSKYDDKIRNSFDEIRRCYLALCPESEIIQKLGISRRTFDRYRNEFPEFKALIDECRDEADAKAAILEEQERKGND